MLTLLYAYLQAGHTPLLAAAKFENATNVKYLLKNGADSTFRNKVCCAIFNDLTTINAGAHEAVANIHAFER